MNKLKKFFANIDQSINKFLLDDSKYRFIILLFLFLCACFSCYCCEVLNDISDFLRGYFG